MNLVHCNPICAVFDLQCSRVGVWDCQKTATFQNYLHLQEWPKITDHLLHFFFMQLQKGTYEWSWNWQVIRFWSVYPCAYLSCNIVFRSTPKYLNTFCMKYWHNTTLSVTNSIFLILQTNYKIAKGKLRILKKNLLLLVCFIPLPSDLILWRCVWFWIRPNRLPKSVR